MISGLCRDPRSDCPTKPAQLPARGQHPSALPDQVMLVDASEALLGLMDVKITNRDQSDQLYTLMKG